MKILLTGATGLLGRQLSQKLFEMGHELVVTTRSPQQIWKKINVPCTAISWPFKNEDTQHLAQVEGVVHLMGESIADGRWNKNKKASLFRSRIDSTKTVFEWLTKAHAPLKTWINASAIGYYGADLDKKYDESSPAGQDFLADLAKAWEDAALNTAYPLNPELRRVILRIGVVLSTEGGALQKMLPAFENHLGGKLSSGRQWFSWIHLDDMVQLITTAIENPEYQGIYNAVSPEPVRNDIFTQTLGRVLKRTTLFPVPAIALKLILGEMSTLLLDGHQVVPKRLLEQNFSFKYPTLESALNHLLQNLNIGQDKYHTSIWLPQPIEKVFDFFCDATNLEDITPDLLQFKVLGMSTETIQEGTTLEYQLKIHGIPKRWKTLIERWDPPHCFVDTQLEGPYSLWHHTHQFTPMRGGTMMSDTVIYQPPLGPFGRLAKMLFIKKDIESIFDYRRKVILEKFGS